MADFIKDVRAEFKEPDLPFILAGPGMDGYGSRGKSNILNAQRRVADRPELNESTIYAETRTFAAKYACLDMDDATCLGLSDAGCDGVNNVGCACADIIHHLEAGYPDGCEGRGEVHPDQKQHWSWNARSSSNATLTLTLTLTLP